MRFAPPSISSLRPSLSLILLVLFLAVLWLAGGTSRADQLGQPVVRAAAWLLLIVAIIFGRRKLTFQEKPVWLFLLAMIFLALAQLVPLPPSVWEALPGRQLFIQAAVLAGTAQPWRPVSIVPSATINALSSLVVPFAVLVFATGLRERERQWLPSLVLAIIVAAMLLGLLQLSGAIFDNPFIDDIPGMISGIFANRNHFALLLAFGILLVPAWALSDTHVAAWRWPAALALVLLFFLTILATGSRAGMVVGVLALVIGLVLAGRPVQHMLRRYPRWVLPVLIAIIVGLIAVFVAISISAERAVSVHRLFTLSPEEDLRRKALPTVWAMIRTYFPFGSGLGDFATVFQIYEPFGFLNLTYFNRAHDDFLEIVLNAGLPGLLLLLGTLAWWLVASIRAWRASGSMRHVRPKLGSAMLLLVFIASIFDYPARTPMMMALIALAALWLSWGSDESRLYPPKTSAYSHRPPINS
jgi:O-antigen ligase